MYWVPKQRSCAAAGRSSPARKRFRDYSRSSSRKQATAGRLSMIIRQRDEVETNHRGTEDTEQSDTENWNWQKDRFVPALCLPSLCYFLCVLCASVVRSEGVRMPVERMW